MNVYLELGYVSLYGRVNEGNFSEQSNSWELFSRNLTLESIRRDDHLGMVKSDYLNKRGRENQGVSAV